jgi:hypothetical protein
MQGHAPLSITSRLPFARLVLEKRPPLSFLSSAPSDIAQQAFAIQPCKKDQSSRRRYHQKRRQATSRFSLVKLPLWMAFSDKGAEQMGRWTAKTCFLQHQRLAKSQVSCFGNCDTRGRCVSMTARTLSRQRGCHCCLACASMPEDRISPSWILVDTPLCVSPESLPLTHRHVQNKCRVSAPCVCQSRLGWTSVTLENRYRP